jgi:hypothetical protein
VTVAGLALLLLLGQADGGVAEPPTPAALSLARTQASEWVEQVLDDGRHVRFGTKDRGPVHTWRPRAFQRETAATVVYLHGFYTDVDGAVRDHRLTAQFRDSGRNALFIVPETRSWRTDREPWPDLEALLVAVEERLRLERPKGPVVLVGHSGAYKPLAAWLAHPRVTQVLLVDGLYGEDAAYAQWLDGGAGRQLVLVGFETQPRAEWLAKKRGAVQLDTLPWLYDELPAATRRAPLVTIASERLDHMRLVEDGRLLPWLLRTFR